MTRVGVPRAVVCVTSATTLSKVKVESSERGKAGMTAFHLIAFEMRTAFRRGARHITAEPEAMSWMSAHVRSVHRKPIRSRSWVKMIGQRMPPIAEPAKMSAIAKPRLLSHQSGNHKMTVVKRLPPKIPSKRPWKRISKATELAKLAIRSESEEATTQT